MIDTVTYGPGDCAVKTTNGRRIACTSSSVTGRLSLTPKGKYGDTAWTVDGKRTTVPFETGSMPLQIVFQFDGTVLRDR